MDTRAPPKYPAVEEKEVEEKDDEQGDGSSKKTGAFRKLHCYVAATLKAKSSHDQVMECVRFYQAAKAGVVSSVYSHTEFPADLAYDVVVLQALAREPGSAFRCAVMQTLPTGRLWLYDPEISHLARALTLVVVTCVWLMTKCFFLQALGFTSSIHSPDADCVTQPMWWQMVVIGLFTQLWSGLVSLVLATALGG